MSSYDIQAKLLSWGAWAKTGKDKLGYPKYSISVPYVQDYANDHVKKAEFITDKDAMQLDGLIAMLKKRDPICADALARYYLSGQNVIDTAKHCNMGRTKLYKVVAQGESWIDGALCMII